MSEMVIADRSEPEQEQESKVATFSAAVLLAMRAWSMESGRRRVGSGEGQGEHDTDDAVEKDRPAMESSKL